MKILPMDQVRLADAYTIANEPVSSADLMERAGVACTDALFTMLSYGQKIIVVAGQGNNGGDGLVIARHLASLGFDVKVFVVVLHAEGSGDFQINRLRAETAGISIVSITPEDDIPQFCDADVIVDAIFGSGLTRPVTGLPAAVINAINSSGSKVIAIDLPSGLFADQHTDPAQGAIVEAVVTLTLELPKLALLMPGNYRYCGDWQVVPIGLHPQFIADASTPYSLFMAEDAMAVFKPRSRVSHKGSFGHGLLMAGSREKGGAAILAAQGALRSGAGLITCFVPESLTASLNAAIPEAMVLTDPSPEYLATLPQIKGYSAVSIGPGIGQADATQRLLYQVINSATCPLVLDADALNILSGQKDWFKIMPRNTIITPHPKEFERLAGASGNDFVRMQKAVDFASEYQCIVILKSAYTLVVTPDGKCSFNIHGNAGLAKGGSGDTLTGIILGLLCRGYTPACASRLAVFAHAHAAEIVAEHYGLDGILASDVANALPTVWKQLERS